MEYTHQKVNKITLKGDKVLNYLLILTDIGKQTLTLERKPPQAKAEAQPEAEQLQEEPKCSNSSS